MNITKEKEEKTLTIILEGRLDTTTSPKLEAELEVAISEDVDTLVFDFENLEYMSSAGLRVMMTTDKLMDKRGGMKLQNVGEVVMDALEITGLVDVLVIE